MTLPEQMAKAAYEKREPGMVWSALSEASREAMTDDMRVALEVALASRSYADLADSATTFDPEEQFDRDIDARKDRGS